MSIALESTGTGDRIERRGLIHGISYVAICDRPVSGRFAAVDRLFPASKDGDSEDEVDSSSSSSIGKNSDLSEGADESGEADAQSSYRGPLENMDALEEGLPVKGGMSKFYAGKSKSFTSLSDAASYSSVKDIVKPENAYTRRRKNLLAYNTLRPSRSSYGGISKRHVNLSRSTLSLAVSMRSAGSGENNLNSSSTAPCLPPLPPNGRRSPDNKESSSPPPRHNFSSWRSFSLSDLQCATVAPSITASVTTKEDGDKLH